MKYNEAPERDEPIRRAIKEELGAFFGVKHAVEIIIDWACNPEKHPTLSSESPRVRRRRLDEERLAHYFRKRT